MARRAGSVGAHAVLRLPRDPGAAARRPRPHAGLVPDAMLAALCIEHGLTMVSADSDFARFTDVTWFNPVA